VVETRCGGEQGDKCFPRGWNPPAAELANEISYRVEFECGYLLEESSGLALKPAAFVGSCIGPERPQRSFRRARVDDQVFVQVAAEDPMDFRKS
jgi:hypothetical protein